MAEENCFGGDKSRLMDTDLVSWLKKIVSGETRDKSHLMAEENCLGGDKSRLTAKENCFGGGRQISSHG